MSNMGPEENIKLAFDLQKQGRYREAISVLYRVLEAEPECVESLIQIAYLFYLYNDVALAVEYYEKALEIDADNLLALQGLFTIFKNAKNFEQAINIAKKLYKIAPNQKNFIQLLMILTMGGKYAEMLALYAKKGSNDKSDAHLNFYLGVAYYNLQKYKEAKEALIRVIEINRENVPALLYIAKIYYEEKHYHLANDYLNEILKYQEDAEVYNLKGVIYLNQKNSVKAANLFMTAIKLNSKNPEYFYNLGITYSLNGWFQEAEKCFLSTIRLDDTNLLYHYTLAYLYYEQKSYTKAQWEINLILKSDAEYEDALILQALLLIKENASLKAKDILDEIIEKNQDNDFAYYAEGMVYKKLGIYKKAIECFHKAHTLNAQSLEYLFEVACCLYENEQYSETLEFLQKLIKICPTYVDAYILKVKILIKQKNLGLAEYNASRIIALNHNSDEGHYLNAQIYLLNNNQAEAMAEIKQALMLKPDNSEYYRFIAKIYETEKSYDSAINYYEEVLKIIPENSTVYFDCAKCAEKNQNWKKAGNYYFRAYTMSPDNIDITIAYVDFMVASNNYLKALNFIYNIIKHHKNSSHYNVLIPKYDEIKQQYFSRISKPRRLIYKLFKR